MTARHWLNGALGAAALLAVFILLTRAGSQSRGIEVERRDPPAGLDEIRVSVTGAVARPGVVTAEPGDRVSDVVARAGGLLDGADVDAVNLSRRVRDEDHIVVPRAGDGRRLLDLNSATAEDLAALPSIGPAYAKAILDARTGRGPFTSTDQLVELRLIPTRVYDDIRDLVTVR